MKDSYVLLLSHRQESFCTERVAGALQARGAQPLRVNTDDFPTQLALSARLSADHAATVLWAGEPICVRAVWLWRLWAAQLDSRLPPQYVEAAQRESAFALRGILDLFAEVPWIDAIDVNYAASNKTRQLRLAQAAGLLIPSTLITSDPAAARTFYHAHGGAVIAKLQTPLSYGMQPKDSLPTRLLQQKDLAALDGLVHCPMVLQRYVQKAYELRIAWVDGCAFVGALDGKKCGVDWRYESTATWQTFALPCPIHAALQRLMTALGLRQGAIDMIVTPENEYIFLEVNPNGEWGMLELELDLPIAKALADALLGIIHRDR